MYDKLLKDWTDQLLNLQFGPEYESAFRGGIRCPACQKIHGRCGDAVTPFLEMYRRTGEDKYQTAAEEVFWWTKRNAVRENGIFINDANSTWTGTTSFSLIALAESLSHYGDSLRPETKAAMRAQVRLSAGYLLEFMPILVKANVNYTFAFGLALELAGKLLGIESYCQTGRELIYEGLTAIDQDGLIFGEGRPENNQTPSGARAIDIGYNIEETLPLLVHYYESTGDETVKKAAVRALQGHLAFFLPDGGVDNSWGTRNAKWSYWGSRTCDGCQSAYSFFQDEYPEFGAAAWLNYQLLASCTKDGMLYGGPMYTTSGNLPCIHHTFSHAVSLAYLSARDIPLRPGSLSLPPAGIRWYNGNRIAVLSNENWRATVSGMDYQYAVESSPTGGSISLLWHKEAGPLMAATMTTYSLTEAANMQVPIQYPVECCTMRVAAAENETPVTNVFDGQVILTEAVNDELLIVNAAGTLVNGDGTGTIPYRISYQLDDNQIEIHFAAKAPAATVIFPIIASETEFAELVSPRKLTIQKKQTRLQVTASQPLSLRASAAFPDGFARIFNPVGGFQYLYIEIPITGSAEVSVKFVVNAI